jgi:hypothetical protein
MNNIISNTEKVNRINDFIIIYSINTYFLMKNKRGVIFVLSNHHITPYFIPAYTGERLQMNPVSFKNKGHSHE